MRPLALATLALACSLCLSAQATTPAAAPKVDKPKTMQDVLAASTASDWRTLDPENTLYLQLATGRVVIELAPNFAPKHSENIRKLVREKYFDGLSINRSQDNFVVQWGDPNGGEAGERIFTTAEHKLPAEFTRKTGAGFDFHGLPDVDGWAPQTGFSYGMPAARNPKTHEAWLTHCYGMVGAGRNNEPDSSTGNELYVVIGQSPRQLDRNMSTVGRVVQGMELLSVLPRGTGPLGFYEKPEQRVPITSITLAADVPENDRANIEILRTDTPTWTALVESRRNRRDDFYKVPAGHIDVCNVPIPTRPVALPAAK
jgi:peptidylprolyl isomerase